MICWFSTVIGWIFLILAQGARQALPPLPRPPPLASKSSAATPFRFPVFNGPAADFGGGILLVSHHLDFTTALCSEKWVVDNGQLQAIGSPDEYFKGEGRLWYARLNRKEEKFHLIDYSQHQDGFFSLPCHLRKETLCSRWFHSSTLDLGFVRPTLSPTHHKVWKWHMMCSSRTKSPMGQATSSKWTPRRRPTSPARRRWPAKRRRMLPGRVVKM